MTQPDDLSDLEKLLGEATPGEWSASIFQVRAGQDRVAHTGMGQLPPSRSAEAEANARLIAAMKTALPSLIERLRSAEGALTLLASSTPIKAHPAGPAYVAGYNAAVDQVLEIVKPVLAGAPPDERYAALQARVAVLEGGWEALADQTNLSLQAEESNIEGEPMQWVVYRENGGRNDREFTEVARAETPLGAIRAALAAAASPPQGGDNG